MHTNKVKIAEIYGQHAGNLYIIAGLFEGEGSVSLTKLNGDAHKKHSIRSNVQFTNTDPILIAFFVDFLKKHEIKYHIRGDVRKKRKHKICYQIQITGIGGKIKFLALIRPKILGLKGIEMDCVLDYLKYRDAVNIDFLKSKKNKPFTANGIYASQSKKDVEFYYQYKQIKGSSETTRKSPYNFKDEDIVQSILKGIE